MLCLSVDKQVGLWSRAAGDGLDIATLLMGLRESNPKRDTVVLALAMVIGITALDVFAAQATAAHHNRKGETRLYRTRTGFPKGLDAAKRAAKDFKSRPKTRALAGFA